MDLVNATTPPAFLTTLGASYYCGETGPVMWQTSPPAIEDHPLAQGRPLMEGESDHTLMSRIRSGDRRAYEWLLERYWVGLVAFATGIVEREDDAKDVVQDVFVRLWRFRSEWSPTGSVSGYLYRITRNLALNASRTRGRR